MSRDSHFEDSGAGPALPMPQPPMPPMNPMQRISNGLSDLDVSSIIRKVFLEQDRRGGEIDPTLAKIRDSALDGDKVWNKQVIEDAMQVFYQHDSLRDENGDKIESISLGSYFVKYLTMDRLDTQQADLRNALYNTFDLLGLASNADQKRKTSFFNSFPPPQEELLCLGGNDSRIDDLKRMLGAKGIERHIIDAYNSASAKAIDLVSLYTNQTAHSKRYIDYLLNIKTKQESLAVDRTTFTAAAEIPTAAIARIIEEFPRNFREYLTRSLSNQELDQEIPPKETLEAKVREVSRGIAREVNSLKNKLDSSGKIQIEYESAEKITEEDLLGIIKEDDFEGLGNYNPRITKAIPLLFEKLNLGLEGNYCLHIKEDGYLEEGSECRFNIDRMRQVLYKKLTKELEEEFLALTEGKILENDNPLPAIPLATRIFSEEISKEIMEKLSSKDPKEIASAIDILHTLSLKTKGNALIHFKNEMDKNCTHVMKLINNLIFNKELKDSLVLHIEKITDSDTGIMVRHAEYLKECGEFQLKDMEIHHEKRMLSAANQPILFTDNQRMLAILLMSKEQIFKEIESLTGNPQGLFDVISKSRNPNFRYIGVGNFKDLDYLGALTHMILREDGFEILDKILSVDGQGNPIPQEFINELLLIIIKIRPNADFISKLIARGANVNHIDNGINTPLHIAAAKGYVDIVKLLIASDSIVIDSKNRTGAAPLHSAAQSGHTEIVRLLLENEANVNMPNNQGYSALYFAAQNGHTKVVELLIERGVDVNNNSNINAALHIAAAKGYIDIVKLLIASDNIAIDPQNRTGGTPLHFAVQSGHTEIVKLLLENEANVNIPNGQGCLPLHLAAKNGNTEIAKLLIAKSIELERNLDIVDNQGYTPLHFAATNGYVQIVELLLDNKVNIDAVDNEGFPVLYIAAQNGHDKVVESLIKKGANVNLLDGRGFSSLYIATAKGHDKVVKLLLENEANVNIPDSKGYSALHIAAANGHTEIVKLLLENKADVTMSVLGGFLALHIAAKNGHTEIVKLLLENKSDVTMSAPGGFLALHNAADNGHTEVVKLLLAKLIELGKGPDISDDNGNTTLHFAAANDHDKVIELLLEKGANISMKNKNGWSALHLAAQKGQAKAVKLLIEKGVEADIINNSQNTPLHIAAGNDHDKVIELLLEKGANIDMKDESGWSALHLAAERGHVKAVDLLIERGADIECFVNNRTRNPLYYATIKGHTEVIDLLIERGARFDGLLYTVALTNSIENAKLLIAELRKFEKNLDITNYQDHTPLYFAAAKGHAKIARLLIINGANVNLKDSEERTPLHIAAQLGHTKVARLLIVKGSDVTAADKDGQSPLHIAAKNGHIKVVKLLLDKLKGIEKDVSTFDNEGRTPLDLAIAAGHTEVAELLPQNIKYFYRMLRNAVINDNPKTIDLLLENRVNFDEVLYIAAKNGHTEVIKLLFEKEVDATMTYIKDSTALHIAAKNGHTEVIKLLLEKGVDVNMKDRDGDTSLHIATLKGHAKIVELLIANKADISIKNIDGDTSMNIAVRNGHTEVVELLKAHDNLRKRTAEEDLEGREGGAKKLKVKEVVKEKVEQVNDRKRSAAAPNPNPEGPAARAGKRPARQKSDGDGAGPAL